MHEFDAGAKETGAAKILEAEHRSGSAFIGTVVLLDDVVQILDLAHDDPLPSSGIHGFENRYIRATSVSQTDSVERGQAAVPMVKDNQFNFTMHPHEIVTLRIVEQRK